MSTEQSVALTTSPLQPASRVMPRHVAIIMDGNGRWAKARGLPRTQGHRRGIESVRRTVTAAGEMGLEHLTLFSFSSENWSRPHSEIVDLMGLAKHFIRRDLSSLHANRVMIRVIGEREGVEQEILDLIGEAEELTRNNTGLKLTFAFNYGGRDEIVRATRRIADDVAAGRLDPADIDRNRFSAALDTHPMPDVDLLIRTSGEYRISNFLLWQCAYAELVFLDLFWPDFSAEDLSSAIGVFQRRDRRFGGIKPLANAS